MGALTFFDKEHTIAVCPDGHQSSPDHAIGAPGPKATPVQFRHRRINPKDAALATTLAALVINAVVEKL